MRAATTPVASNRRQQLLATLLQKAGLKTGTDRIPRRPAGVDSVPLSSGQRRLWFLDRVAPGNPVYNVPTCFRIRGPLDLPALERALNEIVRRHEILRTTFPVSGGEPVQKISHQYSIRVTRIDIGSADERAFRRLAIEDARRPFALDVGPLFRVTLFQLSEHDHVVLITMHHIVCDGWSVGVLFRELAALYSSSFTHSPAHLPDLPVQYADYAAWQRERLEGGKLEGQIDYWRRLLRDAPSAFELPADRQRPVQSTFEGAVLQSEVDQGVSEALLELARGESTTPFVLFLTAYAVFLHRYGGQTDFTVGCPVSNRSRAELEHVIGFFPNTLPIRIQVPGEASFIDLLRRVRELSTQAFAHAEAPFEVITDAVRASSCGHNSLFEVAFTMQEQPPAHIRFGDVEISPVDLDLGTAKCDLTLLGAKGARGLSFALEYSADLFDGATVRRMAGHFKTLLESVASDPDAPVSRLRLMPPAEERRIISEWSCTRRVELERRTLPELFEAHALRQPAAPALIYGALLTTYGELNARADRIARRLYESGAGPGALVAIALQRSPDLIAAILGVLKSGAAYLPIALDHPAGRINFQIEDAAPVMLVTSAACRRELPHSAQALEWLDASRLSEASRPMMNHSRAHSSDLAYVIYTSGSTGTPKGAMLEHGGLSNLALAQQQIFALGPGHRILQFAPITFDASVWEIAMALGSGACLCLGSGAPFVPEELARVLREQRVTTVTLPPSILRVLAPADFPDLKTVVSAGESCPEKIAREWSDGRSFFNAYGPTETTVCATAGRCDANTTRITIGRPLPNVRTYILDPHMRPVPAGVPGELHVAGVGVARGYLNRPELTRARFVPDPFCIGERLYKTGDLARYLITGEIEFLGRIDGQIKIRGHRIEPGEIEARLQSHPTVRECAVVVRKEPARDDRLIAYYVPRGRDCVSSDLRGFIAEAVPSYMVPSAFVALPELPINISGKIDRGALSQLDPSARCERTAARDDLECTIAAVWAELLGAPDIGVHDNFFELGGNSLMAVNLMARIAAATGCDLPVTTLFHAGTVGQIAGLIRERRRSSSQSNSLVKLQPNGSKPPVIAIPPAGGSLICYSEMARLLSPDQPIWGIESPRESEPPASVEAIAAQYTRELRAAGVARPLQLAGWSLGGNVAYEMARQLRGQGDTVDLVLLIDSHVAHKGKEPDDEEILLEIARVQGLVRGVALNVDRRALHRAKGDDHALLIARDLERNSSVAPETIARELRTTLGRFRSQMRAGRRYVPGPYSGRVALLRAHGPRWTWDNGWSRICPGLEVYDIPGTHRTVLAQPHVAQLVSRVREILGTAALD